MGRRFTQTSTVFVSALFVCRTSVLADGQLAFSLSLLHLQEIT